MSTLGAQLFIHRMENNAFSKSVGKDCPLIIYLSSRNFKQAKSEKHFIALYITLFSFIYVQHTYFFLLNVISATEFLNHCHSLFLCLRGFPGGSYGKESACNVGDLGLIPGLGRSPGGRHGNPHQYSCLENSMNRGAWWATVHGVPKSQT